MTRSDYVPASSGGGPSASATTITPIDRIRWASIIAGLACAISLLIVLAVLGAAIGLSAYDREDSARSFAIGAGWWAAISALIAFAFGGWVAARTSAAKGHDNGVLNGAMVWAAAVPLSMMLVAGGLSSLVGTTARTAQAAMQRNTPQAQQQNQNVADQAQLAAARLGEQAKNPQVVEEATRIGAKTAWGTLASLVLGLIAAASGGYVGARRDDVGVSRMAATA